MSDVSFYDELGNPVPLADGEHYYWNRVADKVLRSYGNTPEDAQTHDLGRRICDAVNTCGKEDMERMQAVLDPPAPTWGGSPL